MRIKWKFSVYLEAPQQQQQQNSNTIRTNDPKEKFVHSPLDSMRWFSYCNTLNRCCCWLSGVSYLKHKSVVLLNHLNSHMNQTARANCTHKRVYTKTPSESQMFRCSFKFSSVYHGSWRYLDGTFWNCRTLDFFNGLCRYHIFCVGSADSQFGERSNRRKLINCVHFFCEKYSSGYHFFQIITFICLKKKYI